MEFANVGDDWARPKPGLTGKCPECREAVVSKCGDVAVWHWAHKNSKQDRTCTYARSFSTDRTGESEWHLAWKRLAPPSSQERVVEVDRKIKRADLCTQSGLVCEVQSKPFPELVMREREEHYGRMCWIVRDRRRTLCPRAVGDPNPDGSRDMTVGTFRLMRGFNRSTMAAPWGQIRLPPGSWSRSMRSVFLDQQIHYPVVIRLEHVVESDWGWPHAYAWVINRRWFTDYIGRAARESVDESIFEPGWDGTYPESVDVQVKGTD